MNENNNISQNHSPDETDTTVSSRNISHLFQYFIETDLEALTDPDCLLAQFGITADELEWVLERQK